MGFSHVLGAKDGYDLIMLEGKLVDAGAAQQLQHEIEERIASDKTRFVFDLTRLEYLNSSGLNVLVNVLTKSRNAGGEMVICKVPSSVKELFIVTKLSSVFTTTDTLEEAEAIIKEAKSTQD